MIRSHALLLSMVMAGSVSALAQTQSQSHPRHPQGTSHGAHPAMDPVTHAALHARLHGTWTGVVTTSDGASTQLQLAFASDAQGQLTLKISGDQPLKTWPAATVALDSEGLRWTQPIGGASCTATAVLKASAHHGPDAMKGTMACGNGDVPFVLQKTKG